MWLFEGNRREASQLREIVLSGARVAVVTLSEQNGHVPTSFLQPEGTPDPATRDPCSLQTFADSPVSEPL
eukprot:scaffold17380_cov62-Phaeocystis_antarctica.AAC.4